jgi:hypothetical protein
MPEYIVWTDEMKERAEHAVKRAQEDGCCSFYVLCMVYAEEAYRIFYQDLEEKEE